MQIHNFRKFLNKKNIIQTLLATVISCNIVKASSYSDYENLTEEDRIIVDSIDSIIESINKPDDFITNNKFGYIPVFKVYKFLNTKMHHNMILNNYIIEKTRELLHFTIDCAEKISPNLTNYINHGKTLLHIASAIDYYDAVNYLIAKNIENIDLLDFFNSQDKHAKTALHKAVECGASFDTIQLLAEAGVNPLIKDKNKNTPVYYAYNNFIHHKTGDEILKLLIDYTLEYIVDTDIDLNTSLGKNGENLLYIAKDTNYHEMVNHLINEQNVDPRNSSRLEAFKTPNYILDFAANQIIDMDTESFLNLINSKDDLIKLDKNGNTLVYNVFALYDLYDTPTSTINSSIIEKTIVLLDQTMDCIIKNDIDINIPLSETGETLFLIAAAMDHSTLLLDLINSGNIDINSLDNFQENALFKAAKYSASFDTIKTLINSGANPLTLNIYQNTILFDIFDNHYGTLKNEILLSQCTMDCIIKNGIDINIPLGKTGENLLHMFVMQDSNRSFDSDESNNSDDFYNLLANLIKLEDIDIDATDFHKKTALYKAAEHKINFFVIQTLIGLGANPLIPDIHGNTPVSCFSPNYYEHGEEFYKYVINYIEQNGGETINICMPLDKNKKTLLHLVARFNSYEVVENLTFNSGVDINAQDSYGYTPLMEAISCTGILYENAIESALILIKQPEIDLTLTNKEKNTALHMAIIEYSGSYTKSDENFLNELIIPICEKLLLKGNIDIEINRQNDTGKTPLHIAAQKNMNNTYLKLRDTYQARDDIVDNYGKTPVQYYKENKEEEEEEEEEEEYKNPYLFLGIKDTEYF